MLRERACDFSLCPGSSVVTSEGWVGWPLWASSYLRPGRGSVGVLVHLHPDLVDGVAGPLEQFLKNVLGGALQRQSPVRGQLASGSFHPCCAPMLWQSQLLRHTEQVPCTTVDMAIEWNDVRGLQD